MYYYVFHLCYIYSIAMCHRVDDFTSTSSMSIITSLYFVRQNISIDSKDM